MYVNKSTLIFLYQKIYSVQRHRVHKLTQMYTSFHFVVFFSFIFLLRFHCHQQTVRPFHKTTHSAEKENRNTSEFAHSISILSDVSLFYFLFSAHSVCLGHIFILVSFFFTFSSSFKMGFEYDKRDIAHCHTTESIGTKEIKNMFTISFLSYYLLFSLSAWFYVHAINVFGFISISFFVLSFCIVYPFHNFSICYFDLSISITQFVQVLCKGAIVTRLSLMHCLHISFLSMYQFRSI